MRRKQVSGAKTITTVLLLAVAAWGTSAEASFVFDITQDGRNVLVTGSGTINTSALTAMGRGGGQPEVYPLASTIIGGYPDSSPGDLYAGISGPKSFGTSYEGSPGYDYADSGNGDYVGLSVGNSIVVPVGYGSESPLSDSDTYLIETLAGLGLTPGSYVYTWGVGATADSLIINIGTVPEPTMVALLTVPVTMAMLRRRRVRLV